MKYHKEAIKLPGPPPKWLQIPEYIMVCDACGGNGKEKEGYKACWKCKRENGMIYQGVGYVYRETGEPVPDSVLNQINVERDRVQCIVDALEGVPQKPEPVIHKRILSDFDSAFVQVLTEWDEL
jgi:hypothetical protein